MGDCLLQSPIFVDYDLELSNFYTDYCKLLKFIEYWEQYGIGLSVA